MDHESPFNRLHAIHFAVTWPPALQQLISAGADINCEDDHGRRPIHLAVSLGETSAVEILLRADCALFTPWETLSLLQEALKHRYDDSEGRIQIIHSIIDGLVDRHERLRNLAFSGLPDSSPVLQNISSNCLRENLAPIIILELRKNNISIPAGLELDGKDIYDTFCQDAEIRLTPTLAERLWVGGFRRINDHFDYYSFAEHSTPILSAWHNADFEMVSWLISKGAPPFSKQRELPISGLHAYAARLSSPGGHFDLKIECVHSSMIHLEQLIQEGTCYRDNCSCSCSLQGCTPVSVFVKLIFQFEPPGYDETYTKLELFWKKLLPRSNPRPEQLDEVLRALVFQKLLGTKQHTCCYVNHLSQAKKDWPKYYKIAKDAATPKWDFEAALTSYREKMAKCYCPSIKKPVCAVFRDSCQTMVDGGKNDIQVD